MTRTAWKRMAWIVGALALAVTVFAPSLAESRRLVVRVDEPFEVAGQAYAPNRVTVKTVRAYNPTTVLSEVWVGGQCLGLFRATRVADDEAGTVEALSFERSAAGRLALVGFTVRGHSTPGAYRFEPPARPAAEQVARR